MATNTGTWNQLDNKGLLAPFLGVIEVFSPHCGCLLSIMHSKMLCYSEWILVGTWNWSTAKKLLSSLPLLHGTTSNFCIYTINLRFWQEIRSNELWKVSSRGQPERDPATKRFPCPPPHRPEAIFDFCFHRERPRIRCWTPSTGITRVCSGHSRGPEINSTTKYFLPLFLEPSRCLARIALVCSQ